MSFLKDNFLFDNFLITIFIFSISFTQFSFPQNNYISTYQYISPLPGSSMILPETNIIIRKGEIIDRSSLPGNNTLIVIGSTSGYHDGRLLLSDDGKTIVFYPYEKFVWNETVTVSYKGGILTENRDKFLPFEFQFRISETDKRDVIKSSDIQFLSLENKSLANLNNSKKNNYAGETGNSLPDDFPSITIDISDNPSKGFLFLAPFTWPLPIGYLIIADNSGNVIYYKRFNSIVADFKVQPNGLLTYFNASKNAFYAMDSSYSLVDSFKTGNGYVTDIHELQILPNNHALLMAYDPEPVRMDTVVEGGDSSAVVIGLILQEIDADKNVVFQWRSWDHFLITDATEDISLTNSVIDYVHGNAIELDDDSNWLVSSRSLDEITKINRQTGEIIWRLGGLKSRNNQFIFVNDGITFSHQHDIRRLPNGNITMFDNGNLHPFHFSRALEYQLDEQNKIATFVWDFSNTPFTSSWAMGSMQRLSNHNSVIGWGSINANSLAISEVRADRSIAFELSLPDTSKSYRAFRFPWKTNLFVTNPDSVFFSYVSPGESAIITIDILNNSTDSIFINDIYVKDSSFAVDKSLPFVLPPSGSVPLDIVFSPNEERFYEDTIHIRSNTDTSRVTQILVVAGTGDSTISSVNNELHISSYKLYQNYPNPFNPATKIRFEIPGQAQNDNMLVTLKVYDVLGNEVATLINEEKPAGSYEVEFNGSNLTSGVYFYQLRVTSSKGQVFVQTRKMVLLK